MALDLLQIYDDELEAISRKLLKLRQDVSTIGGVSEGLGLDPAGDEAINSYRNRRLVIDQLQRRQKELIELRRELDHDVNMTAEAAVVPLNNNEYPWRPSGIGGGRVKDVIERRS